jgi:transglutaminase-like putative cysteine protease
MSQAAPAQLEEAQTTSAPAALSGGALDRYFEIALYLMLLTGFVTLASTGGLGFLTVVFTSAALAYRAYLLVRNQRLAIPQTWTNFLTLAYVAFYLADYMLISRTFVTATVHLVLFVTIIRLYSAKRDRDYYFLAVLSFAMVLAAAVLTVDSMFLVSFAAFMLTAVGGCILMEMRFSAAKASIPIDAREEDSRRVGFSLVGVTPLMVLLILISAAAIFFLLPRVSAGYLSAYAPQNNLATGFSDRVELGQIGQIQQSQAVVMHVRVDNDAQGSHELKLRGIALNVFNGRAWIDTQPRHTLPPTLDGRFVVWTPEPHPFGQGRGDFRTMHYQAVVEPLGINVFFLQETPSSLEGNYRQVAVDGGGAVFDLDGDHPISRYEGWSYTARPEPGLLRRATQTYPPEIGLSYLQLPALDSRIPALAAQIAGSAGNSYDKAVAVETYLKAHFGYKLQLSAARPRDPLAEFLFERKQGHCEYFSSSMAVMLRSLGIASRVVNGFRTNEFNDLTGQYVVRQSDAHSWVEAYFPDYGWVSFDPTPAGPGAAHTRWARFLLYVDAMQSFWRDWVVNYDVQHQAMLGDEAVRSSRRSFFRTRRWATQRYGKMVESFRRIQAPSEESRRRWTEGGVILAALLLLAVKGKDIRRGLKQRRLARQWETAPREAAEIWYLRLMALLARRGWRRKPAQTPGEFAASIEDGVLRDGVTRFTTHYEWARFGGFSEHARALPELYAEVETGGKEHR